MAGQRIQLDFESHPYLESDDFPLAFDIGISEVPPVPPAPNQRSEADRVGHLGAHFQFDVKDHRVTSIFADGSLVESEKQQALNKLIDANPQWTEAQMTEALLAAGAKFGPNEKARISARLPVDKLEPMVGKIRIASTEFTFRGNSKEPYFAIMNWTIHFRATTGKHHDEYFISIEPFEGKIVSLGRRRIN